LLVRTTVDPYSLVPDIKREVRAVEPGVAFTPANSIETLLEQNVYAQPRFAAVVMSAFAGIGLLLAAIGIFSVMAYAVSLRTHEFGIRMALGAQRGAVLRIVLWRGMAMIAAGVLIGEVTSLALIRLLRNQLWGVSPYDPLTLAGVVAVLAVAGGIACLVPARRATHVDPMVALRYE
jgi:putative ABC transport system permease protein